MDWTALTKANRRPRIFDPGDGLFWADPYIAEHVVYAHLDDRSDDASRPLRRVEREVEWISSLRAPGRLLDLGCGVGRHALLLAARGWSVTGMDVAEPSLAYARQEGADAGLDARFVAGDIRTAALPPKQDLILIAYGTLGTLSPAQARRLVARCRKALSPGGLLVFDAFRRPWWERQKAEAERGKPWDVVPRDGFWSEGPHLVLSRFDAYPRERTFGRTYTVVEPDRVRRFPLWYRWYDPQHLKDELLAGWTVQFTGGLDGRRLTPDSPWVAVVAREE